MKINENKVCFIVCVNDNIFFDECIKYINWLERPEEIVVEIMEVRDAKSMTSGYNEGMNISDAKYKVYLHQDTFIRNKYFLQDILSIFHKNNKIGMIGLTGCLDLPSDGIMWHENRVDINNRHIPLEESRYKLEDGYWEVDAIDGLLMATQYDIPWREDLFDGWDYYDVSHCMEMEKEGYSVVVPRQNQIWYIHDDKGVIDLWNYDKYRKIFLREYRKE